MKIRQLVSLLAFLPLMALSGAVTLDPDGVTEWHDGRDLPLEGRAWTDTPDHWSRLPSRAKDKVTPEVWSLSNWSAGLALRFTCSAPKFRVNWSLKSPRLAWPHFPATNVSGIDVYAWRGAAKGWRYAKCQKVWSQRTNEMEVALGPNVPVMIYLPTYNGISDIRIGVPKGAKITAVAERPEGHRKPLVVYGTSITEGACASRPGMGYAMILARDLDLELVNLGFAGAARQEPAMADLIGEIDAACYVVDCLHNMDLKMVKERFEPFLRRLHGRRPDVPIVTADACTAWMRPSAKDLFCRETVRKLKAEDPKFWSNLRHLPCEEMYPDDGDPSVDGCHPNDWGMKFVAKGFAKYVRLAMSANPAAF